jgi:hypothetical protein
VVKIREGIFVAVKFEIYEIMSLRLSLRLRFIMKRGGTNFENCAWGFMLDAH